MKKTSQNGVPSRSTPKSPSWVVERDAIRDFGDRKTRAILAIYHARRSAKKGEFFVHPEIARCWGLSAADLNWALGELEGVMVETLTSKKGRYRTIRLLPPYEETGGNPTIKNMRIDCPLPGEERVIIDTEVVLANIRREGCPAYLS